MPGWLQAALGVIGTGTVLGLGRLTVKKIEWLFSTLRDLVAKIGLMDDRLGRVETAVGKVDALAEDVAFIKGRFQEEDVSRTTR